MPHHSTYSFVGREPELAELCGGFADARRGCGRLFLLAGEPGIGKTALAEELARRAGDEGFAVCWGRCWEGRGAPAYWPWIQVIRGCLRERDGNLSSLAPDVVDDLHQIVPEIRPPAAPPRAQRTIGPEQARFRLFDSVVGLLRTVSSEHPLLFLLDDLHWADDASLLLLHFVARELRGLSLLLIGTYRDAEARLKPAVGSLLVRSAREGRTLPLIGLSADEIRMFITVRLGDAQAGQTTDEVQRLTEGNPLFVEELLNWIHAQGPTESVCAGLAVPDGLRDIIRRRLDRFDDATRAMLATAAVLQPDFDRRVLEHMIGRDVADLIGIAVTANILVAIPGPGERYRFSHALIAETLYADIPPTTCVEWHRQAAHALVAHFGNAVDSHLQEIAHHFSSAAPGGDAEAAVGWGLRAGVDALAQLAFEAAASTFERVLEVMRSTATVNDAPRWARTRVELLIHLGTARNRAGDVVGANEALLGAIGHARDLGDAQLLAMAVLTLAATRTERGATDRALIALLEESLDRLGTSADGLRARLMARLASSFYLLGPGREHAAISLEAVALARRCNDRGALASALTARHSVCWEHDSCEERLATATEIVRLAQEAGEEEAALDGMWWRIFDLLELGDVAAADSASALYEQRAQEARLPRQCWYASVLRTMQALRRGRFSDAERLAGKGVGVRQAEGAPPSQFYGVQMFIIRREQGRLAELEPAIRALALQYPKLSAWQSVIALFHCANGARDAAGEIFAHLAAQNFADIPYDVNRLTMLSMLAEICHALGDRVRAKLLYALLLPYAGRHVVIVGAVALRGAVDYFLGLLAAAMARWDDAVRHFETACDAHRRMQAWALLAHAQHALATALLKLNPHFTSRAATLIDQALATAANLGMRHLEEQIGRELAAWRAAPDASFRRDGSHWAVRLKDTVVRLKDNHGCVYIAYLLARPGQAVPATELVAAAGAMAASDEHARLAVRKAVASVLRALGRADEALQAHLAGQIRTGRTCTYTPSNPTLAWDVEPELR